MKMDQGHPSNHNPQPLRGKVVIITGGASGLGKATALAFAREGSCVVCLDVNPAGIEEMMPELDGGLALYCNVRDEADVSQAVRQVLERYGRVDVLVNNAAVDHTLSVEEMSVAQWDQVIGVNLRGPFLMAKAVLPAMRRQGGGQIVNVASTAAQRAWANASAYHASKWGLVGFGRGLGVEGRADNIRVTTILPGGMATHFFDRFANQGIPMPDEGNLQDPANVAAAILFAARMPAGSSVQEMIVTPITETSWP
jgi:NAD(P)-dependent dehydrogenase (short-subunit alcohol dehydrogenase family)